MSVLDTLENAIAQFEGYNTPGSVAARNNNPGNLMYADWERNYGGAGSSGSIAHFPDAQSGFDAMDALVQTHIDKGDSISQLIGNTWSPASGAGNSPESTQNYIRFVGQQTGIDPNTPLNSALASGQGVDSTLRVGNKTPVNAPSPWALPDWFNNIGADTTIGKAILGSNGMFTPDRIKSDLADGSANAFQKIWQQIEAWLTDTFGASRIAAVLVGLIALAGGIYLFKPVQQAASNVARTAKAGMELAAA